MFLYISKNSWQLNVYINIYVYNFVYLSTKHVQCLFVPLKLSTINIKTWANWAHKFGSLQKKLKRQTFHLNLYLFLALN